MVRLFASLLVASLVPAAPAQTPASAGSPPPPVIARYDQPYRPQVHFSPEHNWTNDPNGLVFFHGEYHLFFQYNPFGDEWGHMSWGHAVSRDLLHWQQLPVAIPEAGNTMIFTGSVVVDKGNTSGFCAGSPCLVAVYTGHTQLGKAPDGQDKVVQTQNLAWSRDDGRTWTAYKANPVLDLHLADFRDPSVSWDDATHRWIMAVSLPKEHKVRLYSSPDLKHWAELSDFGPLGDVAGDWECPDLLHIPADNGKGPGTWAMKVGLNPGGLQGGSGEQYFLGSFNGKTFTADPAQPGWTNYGKDDYCAISFNGLPRTQKPVLIGWMNNWQYAAKLPTSPWRGQFSVPRRLSLLTDSAGSALKQVPITAPLRMQPTPLHVRLTPQQPTATVATTSAPFELQLRFTGNAPLQGVRLRSDDQHYTEIGFDTAKHVFYIDRTHSGRDVAPGFPGRVEAPLAPGRPLDLQLIVDRSSVEAYAQEGTLAMTDLIFPLSEAAKVEFLTKTAQPLTVQGTLWKLRSIWTRLPQQATR